MAGSSYDHTWVTAEPVPDVADTWTISLNGTISDPAVGGTPGSGLVTESVMVSLVNSTGKTLDGEAQQAIVNEDTDTWTIDYLVGGEKP